MMMKLLKYKHCPICIYKCLVFDFLFYLIYLIANVFY